MDNGTSKATTPKVEADKSSARLNAARAEELEIRAKIAEIAHRISALPLGEADDIARMLATLSALGGAAPRSPGT